MDASADQVDSVDVLIVGAGISGIGAAYYLQRDHPGRSYAILEARGASGGTWDLFRFPGVRSDSDLHTFGYEFRPWRSEVAIADGDSILAYLRETAAEYGIDRHIRYHTKVVAAAWSVSGRPLDRDDRRRRHRRAGRRHLQVAASARRATTATTRASRRTSRGASGSAGRSSTRSSGRRTSTTRASGSWSSGRARPRSR